ncbi:BPTI/Kunitz domain-containing protein [Eucyclogobius newberryi]|uniref:BPTI/Kunitz domain-containing protein n=1 Tax=Eucyclogobius newberryi TaxID=166745 RepID=UPI003B59CC7C
MKLLLFLGTAVTLVHSGHLIPDFCFLPKDEGTGATFMYAVHYDKVSDLCQPFLYKGEGGNANRFKDEAECIRNCSANAENIYPMDLTKACHLPKSKGGCGGKILSYYYDSVHDHCKKFHYTGCFGNGNRFINMESCNATCDGIHDDREEEEDIESDTPVAIICGVLLALIVCSIVITVIVLTVKSKKKEAKKGEGRMQQDVPLQDATVEMS